MRTATLPSQRATTRVAYGQLVMFAQTLALDTAGIDRLIEDELAVNPALERVRSTLQPAVGIPNIDDTLAVVLGVREELAVDMAATLPAHERPLAFLLVAELDDRGFLDVDPHELASRAGITVDRVHAGIEVLQMLGPVGLATEGPIACVLAQLERAPIAEAVRGLAAAILSEHLPAVAAGDLQAVAIALETDVESIRSSLDAIRAHTRPTPCWDGAIESPPPLPDLVVDDDEGCLRVLVLERERYALTIASSYLAFAADHPHVIRARSLLERLEDRWRTLQRVAEYVVTYQERFVGSRQAPLRDLTRTKVAADLDVHPSTVSRAVAHRSVVLPDRRTLPLAALFGTGGEVRHALARLLADGGGGSSDAELARELSRRGLTVARRTVTKYRAELGVTRQR